MGFGLEDEADRKASRRVAEVSGGAFFDTTDGEGLKESILKTMNPVFEVKDAGAGLSPEVPQERTRPGSRG